MIIDSSTTNHSVLCNKSNEQPKAFHHGNFCGELHRPVRLCAPLKTIEVNEKIFLNLGVTLYATELG